MAKGREDPMKLCKHLVIFRVSSAYLFTIRLESVLSWGSNGVWNTYKVAI